VKRTVFVNVKNDMTIAQEEIFRPMLSVISYDSEDEANWIAYDSEYGLHVAVLGIDFQRARRVVSQIRAGRVVINNVTDDPQTPWGVSSTRASAANMASTESKRFSNPGRSSRDRSSTGDRRQ
jgi:acyl-CoA reductase-like NAD-dependent aldehyde dehydrogenase